MCVHADGRKVATDPVTPDPEALARWGRAASLSTTGRVHSCGDGLTRWETSKKSRIVDHHLSVDDGAPTPGLRVKCQAIEAVSRPLPDTTHDGQRRG